MQPQTGAGRFRRPAPSCTWRSWWPTGVGGRWWFTGLWNWIDASDPIISLRINEQVFIQRYNVVALDASCLPMRNIRFTGEVGFDTEIDNFRLVLGVVSAF
jgi:hypothetical protein